MDAFSYLSVLISIVVGLALASPLTGFAAMVRARARVAMHWPLAAQMILIFLGQVQLWWALLLARRRRGDSVAHRLREKGRVQRDLERFH